MRQIFPLLVVFSGLTGPASATTVTRALPDLDVWNYPFNFTPGYRSAISTFSALGQEELAGLNKTDASSKVGALVANKAKEAGVTTIVFDRNGYPYHGRVAALAKGARDGGLEF